MLPPASFPKELPNIRFCEASDEGPPLVDAAQVLSPGISTGEVLLQSEEFVCDLAGPGGLRGGYRRLGTRAGVNR